MTIPDSGRDPADNRPALPGAVAGAVLRAARSSARATEAALAAAAGVSEDQIRAWEDGTHPLSEVPFPQFERLEAALAITGADASIVADLAAAALCDLVIAAVGQAGNVACLIADPIMGEHRCHDLMIWALTGHVPAAYSRLAATGPLVTDSALAAEISQVLDDVAMLSSHFPAE
jgi:transcriptional regulator with XRE-family HTH domain